MAIQLPVFPAARDKEGPTPTAPYGLRKTEAQLIKEGFKVNTISPKSLKKALKNAKVLGIHTMDPFGLGPASTTLAALFKKEPYLSKHFHNLLQNPEILKAKQRGLKIIAGGPGAWQFQYRAEQQKKLGIDCVVEGEGENVIGKLFRAPLKAKSCQVTTR
jgi:radical SAM superfamily enzyme YgiQ (UPF0313 family)